MKSLAPIINFPNEIIQEIFSHIAPSDSVLRTHSSTSRRFPWVLGHICSKWRAIFLSMTPQFWSRISIHYEAPHFHQQKVERIKEMAEFFVNRNRAETISFDYRILAFTVASHSAPDDMHPVLELLVEQSMRWESVTILIAQSDLPILRRIRNRLPMLRKLVISMHEPRLLDASNDMFEDAPLLRDVVLMDTSWKIKWSALTTLELRTAEKVSLAILPHVSNLENLSIISIYERTEIEAHGPITLPRLKTLTVRHEAPSFLDVLEAPELENLELACEIGNARTIIGPSGVTYSFGSSSTIITSFLSRSSCPIHHLTLTVIDGESLASILRYTPELESLKLTLRNKYRGLRSLGSLTAPERSDDAHDASRTILTRDLKSLTIVAYPSGGHTDDPFLQEEISMLIDIIKFRTVAVDKNEGTVTRGRLQNLTIDMPSSAGFPAQLISLKSVCTEVAVTFRYSLVDG